MTARITARQLDVLRILAPLLEPNTYLAGGVAVANTLGHRFSYDLDLFVPQDFDSERLQERLVAQAPGARILSRAERTLHLELDGIPVSILGYRYPTLKEPSREAELPVPVASLDDLACMKISAIAGRGAAKDFWDVHDLLVHGVAGGSLDGALELYCRKYVNTDRGHVIRSLVYFADADAAPLPLGLTREHWDEIRASFRARVKAL